MSPIVVLMRTLLTPPVCAWLAMGRAKANGRANVMAKEVKKRERRMVFFQQVGAKAADGVRYGMLSGVSLAASRRR
jgi:hypothetical protein